MGFYRFRMKCPLCKHEWNSFFNSVNMTSGSHNCPGCNVPGGKVANDWKTEEGRWMDELEAEASFVVEATGDTIQVREEHGEEAH